MTRNVRAAALVGAILFSMFSMGAVNPFKRDDSSSHLRDRVDALERENAKLRSEIADINRKLEVMAQRVNASCGSAPGNIGGANRAAYSQTQAPPLEVVRVKPDQARPIPQRPAGISTGESSAARATTRVENGAPLPGTNYVPLPDPAETPNPAANHAPPSSAPAASAPAPVTPGAPPEPSAEDSKAYEQIKTLMGESKVGEAMQLMEQYISGGGGAYEAEVAAMLADCYASKGMHEKAIETYKIVTDKHYQNSVAPEALYQTGLSYLALGAKSEACEALREVRILYSFSQAARKAEEELANSCE